MSRSKPTAHAPAATVDARSDSASRSTTRVVTLDSSRAAPLGERRANSERGSWLIAPTLLAATISGILLVLRGPDRYFGFAFGALLALAVSWILISVLFPAKVDRTCPMCGRESLRRLDAQSTRGVICADCGHIDLHQSSFLMAEADGSLEQIVIAERERAGASEVPPK